jgi:hypothetical protein
MEKNDTGLLKGPDDRFFGGAVQFVPPALEIPHGAACDARPFGQLFLRPVEQTASGSTLFR